MARVPVTEESFEEFLRLVANGTPRWEAAQQIGTTSTRVRWFVKRNPTLQRRYDTAMLQRRRFAELRRLTGVE